MLKSEFFASTPIPGGPNLKTNIAKPTLSHQPYTNTHIQPKQPKEDPKKIVQVISQEVEDLVAAKQELKDVRDFLNELKVQGSERQLLEDKLKELEFLLEDEDFYLHLKYVYDILLLIGKDRSENVTRLSDAMTEKQAQCNKVDEDVIRRLATQKETLNECTIQSRIATEKQIASLEILVSPQLGQNSLNVQSQMSLTRRIQDQYIQLEKCAQELSDSSDRCEEKYQAASAAVKKYDQEMCKLCVWNDSYLRRNYQETRYEHLMKRKEMMDERLTEMKVTFDAEKHEADKLEKRFLDALDSAQQRVIRNKSSQQIAEEETNMINEVLQIKQQIADTQNEVAESDRQIIRIRENKNQKSQMQLFAAVVAILLLSFVFFNYC